MAADPKLVDAHIGAGQMLDMLGLHEEARQQQTKAIALAGPETKDQARTALAVSVRVRVQGGRRSEVFRPGVQRSHCRGKLRWRCRNRKRDGARVSRIGRPAECGEVVSDRNETSKKIKI